VRLRHAEQVRARRADYIRGMHQPRISARALRQFRRRMPASTPDAASKSRQARLSGGAIVSPGRPIPLFFSSTLGVAGTSLAAGTFLRTSSTPNSTSLVSALRVSPGLALCIAVVGVLCTVRPMLEILLVGLRFHIAVRVAANIQACSSGRRYRHLSTRRRLVSVAQAEIARLIRPARRGARS